MTSSRTSRLAIAAILFSTAFVAMAQTRSRDSYRLLRYDEDYSHLCNDKNEAVKTIKCIPLGPGRYLSLGGEERLKYERYSRSGWGAAPEDRDGYLLQRYMFHGDLHLRPDMRAFVQLKTGLEDGRRGGPRPSDEDGLDLHEAFVDLGATSNDTRFTIRAGRQEIALGNHRLVTVRNGANVRLSFSGVRALIATDDLDATIFVLRPVKTRTGAFDDAVDEDDALRGVHVARRREGFDVYYLDHTRSSARFDQGVGREHRRTLGARVSGRARSLSYDVDGILQRGTFGEADIDAWAVLAEAAYAFPASSQPPPRAGLRIDLASGDDDRGDSTLGTFHPLYPRAIGITEAPLLGVANRIAVRPFVEWSPRPPLTLAAEVSAVWRESNRDGLYRQDGVLMLPAGASRERFVGHEIALAATWRLRGHTSIRVTHSLFRAGPFLRDVTPGRNLTYLSAAVEHWF